MSNDEGPGATLHLSLPSASAAVAAGPLSEPGPGMGPKSKLRRAARAPNSYAMRESRLRVAVVDDEETVRRALGRFFQAAGYDVETYGSGSEFLDAASGNRPDCAVIDVHLTGLTAMDVLDRLAAAGIVMPTVVVTGRPSPERRRASARVRGFGLPAQTARRRHAPQRGDERGAPRGAQRKPLKDDRGR